jgi:hypothetical protein
MRIVENPESARAKPRKVRPNGAACTARPGSYGEAVVRVGLLLNAFPHLRLPRVVLDFLASKQ